MSTQTATATPAVMSETEKASLLATIAALEAKLGRKAKLANALKLSGYGKDGKATISLAVSDKGALSFYGFNVRFPLTMYKSAILFILDHAEQIRAFITANDSKLSQGKES
jgi:hypothetical protein